MYKNLLGIVLTFYLKFSVNELLLSDLVSDLWRYKPGDSHYRGKNKVARNEKQNKKDIYSNQSVLTIWQIIKHVPRQFH